ncbi:MAG: bifunctional phosphopantothenoylcysteine decarboxylase/phosphopantothenate--cysteine ligase CoaBC [Myxococcales bacterium]|nr:bifunctional phosphopantothenoylcysteine decarboxylase/phosphopantothenate--cysteine ligase CoaBC [Myxococcales bacterium]
MTASLAGKEVLLVVGGGIAAYKSAILARELLRAGAKVETILTDAAQKFVGGVTFAGLTGRAARTELWDANFSGELHVELAARAELIVVAPATADLLARAANGIANDLATATLLCAKSPVVFAPAMHPRMWEHPATRENIAKLVARGAQLVGPVVGPLASGEVGIGRMEEPERIAEQVIAMASRAQDLRGVRVLVSAGPTHEAIDPVRFVGNRSSGKMGLAIADAAHERGASVTVVHGPITARAVHHEAIERVAVRSALEMQREIEARKTSFDVIVMAAAVADYRPDTVATHKIKKGQDRLVLELVKNPDILAGLGAWRGANRRPVLVGFAVETGDLVGYARSKLERKGCDLVVANLAEHGFEGDDNTVTIVSRDAAEEIIKKPKRAIAERILDNAKSILDSTPSDA